jgi:hypothetical protein
MVCEKGPFHCVLSCRGMGVPVKQRLVFDMVGDGSLWKGLLQNYPLVEEIQDFCKVANVLFGEQLLGRDSKGGKPRRFAFCGEELNQYIRPVMRSLQIILLTSFSLYVKEGTETVIVKQGLTKKHGFGNNDEDDELDTGIPQRA